MNEMTLLREKERETSKISYITGPMLSLSLFFYLHREKNNSNYWRHLLKEGGEIMFRK